MRFVKVMAPEEETVVVCIEDAVRVVISPSTQDDGNVLLSAKIYGFVDSKFVLSSEPKLTTSNY